MFLSTCQGFQGCFVHHKRRVSGLNCVITEFPFSPLLCCRFSSVAVGFSLFVQTAIYNFEFDWESKGNVFVCHKAVACNLCLEKVAEFGYIAMVLQSFR